MKNIARLCLLSPFLLSPLTSMAQTQEIDPYELYKAAQAQDTITEPQPEDPQIIIPENFDSRLETDSVTAPDAVQIDISADEIAPQAEAPQILSVENPQDGREDAAEDIEATIEEVITEPAQSLDTADDIALPAPSDLPANAVDTPVLNRADIAPYFLSAREYLQLRGDAADMQTRLTYTVVQSDLTGEAEPKAFDVTLMVGRDYVAKQSSQNAGSLRLYDFKYNRLLTVSGSDDDAPQTLINAPLFAIAHRKNLSLEAATQNGKRDSIALKDGKTLSAFWIESAFSLAAADRSGTLILDSRPNAAVLRFEDEDVFSVTLSDESFEDADQSDAMLAFAHLEWPVHPAGLKQFYSAGPAAAMTIISKSPNAPDGQKQVWTLTGADTTQSPLPLPATAINTLTDTKSDPIAVVMNMAARGTAPGGRPDEDALSQAVIDAMDTEDFEAAWLAAKRYERHSRPCKKNNIRKACKIMRDIEDMRKMPDSLKVLLSAYENADEPKKRVQTLQSLTPWLETEETPADIMRLAGVLRAKIDPGTAKAAGLETINARELISSALIADPYNPQTYLAMAQFSAATGDYEAAWNVFDTLRSAIAPDEKAKFAVDKVERGLLDRTPGYFAPALMAER